MNYFHGSRSTITEISAAGVFGGVFAASSAAAALSHGKVLHVVESPRPLTNFELNYSIEGAWEAALEIARGDERVAEAIMGPECNHLDDCDPEDAGEQGWEFQRLRGLLAVKLGYTSVEMRDEHGTTWLCVPGCSIRPATDDDR